MLTPKMSYVMVMVSDMKRSVEFYRDTLGLPLRFESPHWSELATDGVTLALHGGGGEGRGVDGAAGSVEIGWQVDDLDAVAAALGERGVRFVQAPTDRPEEGIRLATLVDPDGARIHLSQSTR